MAEETTFEGFVLKLFRALNKCDVDYIVVGGVAAIYYGRPRTTSDCDIILSLRNEELEHFVNCLRRNGFVIRKHDVLEAFREKSHFNAYLGSSPFRADFSWREGSLAEHGFSRAKAINLLGVRVHIEAPEDIIIAKLVYGSPQDLEDAKAILLVQKKLDRKYLARRAGEEGVRKKLQQLLRPSGK